MIDYEMSQAILTLLVSSAPVASLAALTDADLVPAVARDHAPTTQQSLHSMSMPLNLLLLWSSMLLWLHSSLSID
jgi:hypothetical protein